MRKDLILIDGSSFIFRAFYALPNLTSPTQKPTGATYGVANMLKQMLKKYNTPHWCCIFDAPGETFRHQMYADYKATRRETPAELIPQFADIHALVTALGIPVVIEPGVEADDVIGTLAILAKANGYNVIIATGDKDFAQIVEDNITLVNTMTNEILDHNAVIDKFGVAPQQIVDYLALVGDKVDNVPGVDKCGPKTAVKWLQQYQNLTGVIAAAPSISGVVGENLRQALPWLATAKDLVTIRTNLDVSHIIPHGVSQLMLAPADNTKLRQIYSELGFKTWLKQLDDTSLVSTVSAPQHEAKTATTITSLPQNLAQMSNKKLVLLVSPTDLLHTVDKLTRENAIDRLVITLNSFDKNDALSYLIFATPDTIYVAFTLYCADNAEDLFSQQNVAAFAYESNFFAVMQPLFNSSVAKTCINYKETLTILTQKNLVLTQVVDDITLLHYVLNSKSAHTPEYIYRESLALDVADYAPNVAELLVQLAPHLSSNDITCLTRELFLVNYAYEVAATIRTKLSMAELKLYQTIELPLVEVLVAIENNGIKLHVTQLRQLELEITQRIQYLEQIIYRLANCVFNINSTKQLQDVLFNQMHLSTLGIKKNTNGFSTDEDSLRVLAGQRIEIANYLIEYRGLTKLLNTYISKLPPLVDKHSRLHTTFEQALVASGRLSSKEPNLQNIPIKSEWGRKIRQCFVAQDGYLLVCADYSQIELRILAHFSRDDNLVNAFNTGQDIHTITASEIFHKPLHEVSKEERRYAKTINFSLLYGKTVYGLANELEIDRATAKHYIDTYFAKYPKVLACLEQIKDFARNHGYVETVYGRRIYLPNILATNKIQREAEERLALNAPMQGTSADIIKIAMCRIQQWLTKQKLASRMILQVHDELIFEVPQDEVELVSSNLPTLMTQDFSALSVKLAVEVKTATNWDEAH